MLVHVYNINHAHIHTLTSSTAFSGYFDWRSFSLAARMAQNQLITSQGMYAYSDKINYCIITQKKTKQKHQNTLKLYCVLIKYKLNYYTQYTSCDLFREQGVQGVPTPNLSFSFPALKFGTHIEMVLNYGKLAACPWPWPVSLQISYVAILMILQLKTS